MHLGEVIKQYRLTNSMSQSDFAKASGISKAYISMLENNKNPSTGEPIVPTYTIFEKVANVLSCSTDSLLKYMDGSKNASIETIYDAKGIHYLEHSDTIIISNLSKIKFDSERDPLLSSAERKRLQAHKILEEISDEKIEALLTVLR